MIKPPTKSRLDLKKKGKGMQNETEDDIIEEMMRFWESPQAKRNVSGEFVGGVLFGFAKCLQATKKRRAIMSMLQSREV